MKEELIKRLKKIKKEYCTGPCGSSQNVLRRREETAKTIDDAIKFIQSKSEWVHINDELPPEEELVETRVVESGMGEYIVMLKRVESLYYLNGEELVYYEPTYWRRN